MTNQLTINNIEYTAHRQGSDIICMPTENDDHTLILYGGYDCVKSEAFSQARDIYQVHEIANDLMPDFVLLNKSELIRIEL